MTIIIIYNCGKTNTKMNHLNVAWTKNMKKNPDNSPVIILHAVINPLPAEFLNGLIHLPSIGTTHYQNENLRT